MTDFERPLYKTSEAERAGLCPRCGSVVSVVTWTCVRGQFCPGERSSSTGNKVDSGNKMSTVKGE